jgi:ABC-type spermidine/putrescine transport system permease subunit II
MRRKRTNYISRITNAYIKVAKATCHLAIKSVLAVAFCAVMGCLVLGTEANYSTARVKDKASKMENVIKGIGTVTQIVKAIK